MDDTPVGIELGTQKIRHLRVMNVHIYLVEEIVETVK